MKRRLLDLTAKLRQEKENESWAAWTSLYWKCVLKAEFLNLKEFGCQS